IATALRIAEEYGFELVLDHGTESYLIADRVAATGVPVLYGPLIVSRSKAEVRHRTPKAPGILAGAGVKVSLITDHPVVPIEFLVHQAALAVKHGMEPDEALRSITINPAEVLGLGERLGTLDVGKDADLVLWDGDPLDTRHRAQRVWQAGREVMHLDAEGEPVIAARRAAGRAAQQRPLLLAGGSGRCGCSGRDERIPEALSRSRARCPWPGVVPRWLSIVDPGLAGLHVHLDLDVLAVLALDVDRVLDVAVVGVQLPALDAPVLLAQRDLDRLLVRHRGGDVDGRLPIVIGLTVVVGDLAGGGIDVELVLLAVELDLDLPLPGPVVVVDLDGADLAPAGGLESDVPGVLGRDGQSLG